MSVWHISGSNFMLNIYYNLKEFYLLLKELFLVCYPSRPFLFSRIDESVLSRCEGRTSTNDDPVKMQQSLFERLCPLLIIRMLPLRIFDDLNLSAMYDKLLIQGIMHGMLFCLP